MEIEADVSDDASNWTPQQSYTGSVSGKYKDSNNNLQSFSYSLNVSNGDPISSAIPILTVNTNRLLDPNSRLHLNSLQHGDHHRVRQRKMVPEDSGESRGCFGHDQLKGEL